MKQSKGFSISLLTLLFSSLSFAQISENQISTFLKSKGPDLGLKQIDRADWFISSSHSSSQFPVDFAYVQQQYNGVEIHNAILVIAGANGELRLTGNTWEKNVAERVNTTSTAISAEDAVSRCLSQLGLQNNGPMLSVACESKLSTQCFLAENVASSPIHTKLVYEKDQNNDLRLAYRITIEERSGDHWWSVRLDAITGEIINKNDWVVSCQFNHDHSAENCQQEPNQEAIMLLPAPPPSSDQYTVYALPVESPNHGSRTTVINPADPNASPFGWHDVDGVSGAEYTITRGNNVYTSEDADNDDNPGYSSDGGASLDFDFPLSFNTPNVNQWDGVITNLFYMNNMIHDVFYHYGFDEASGNFQENNYGNGGQGGDQVNADAQDGSGTNNANFGTPEDGQNPRMQMYLWGNGGASQSLEITTVGPLQGFYDGVEAVIGPGLPVSTLNADLVLFDDATGDAYDACEAAVNGSSLAGKIVVIRRGTCAFGDKIFAAQNEGAIAVIVVNNQGGAATAMGGTDPGVTIPAIMVTMADGEAIIAALETGNLNGSLGDFGPFDFDSSLDNGIVAHEYGHGISTRLTGGPDNSDCLWNAEQMGEGWSDWFALILTIEPGDQGANSRGMATYANGDPITGAGIRPAPYSTNWSINNYTYGATNNLSLSEPHGIGFVWCSMLWDLTWALIDEYGFDSDIYNGVGGNNIAMHLIMNGMKLQPCNPGFVDGRDAILEADELLYGGANICKIWEVFAKRGLGYSADQGDPFNREDQTAAFDLPPAIDHNDDISACQTYTWPVNGQTYTTSGVYTAPITPNWGCDDVATLDLTITSTINSSVSYNGPTTLHANNDLATSYQWVSCSNDFAEISGATGQDFTPTVNGVYAVIVSDGNCTDTSVCMLINQAAIEDVSLTNFQVYPNPTTGKIAVEITTGAVSNFDVILTNSLGQVVDQIASLNGSSTVTFDITGSAGVYFIRVVSEGKHSIPVKLVKH